MGAAERLMYATDAGSRFGVRCGIVGVIDSYGAIHLQCWDSAETEAPWHADLWPGIYHKHWRIWCGKGTIQSLSGWTPDEIEREEIFDKSLKAAISFLLKKLK